MVLTCFCSLAGTEACKNCSVYLQHLQDGDTNFKIYIPEPYITNIHASGTTAIKIADENNNKITYEELNEWLKHAKKLGLKQIDIKTPITITF